MSASPRLRIAPSPTGYFHVGTARTALYNWLYARQHGGVFVLRIEDTDRNRHVEEAVAGIPDALRWLGLDWDEGPFFQSELAGKHRAAADKLWEGGFVYACDCTREQIDERTKGSATPGYDRHCRDRGLERGDGRTLRFAVPQDGGSEVVHDLVRESPMFAHAVIDDFTVVRADGSPLFLLANVVDDIEMGITHIVRGDDHLSNTPKQQLLWRALGAGDPPVYAHLPMLVDEQRKKLSKRKGHRVEMEEYRDSGILAEAMVNYLALLGWAPGDDREIVDLETLIAEFRLEDVQSSPAFFDEKKLTHVNAVYIRNLPEATFVQRSLPWVESPDVPWSPEDFDLDVFNRVAPLVQTRVERLGDVPEMVDFLFVDDDGFAARVESGADVAKHITGNDAAPAVLTGIRSAYATVGHWDAATIESATWPVGEELGLNKKKTQFPIRVAVTGRAMGPPLFESLEALGRERALARIDRALATLG